MRHSQLDDGECNGELSGCRPVISGSFSGLAAVPAHASSDRDFSRQSIWMLVDRSEGYSGWRGNRSRQLGRTVPWPNSTEPRCGWSRIGARRPLRATPVAIAPDRRNCCGFRLPVPGVRQRPLSIFRLLQGTLDKGPFLVATAIREAPPEPFSPEAADLFIAVPRFHCAQGSLHRPNIAMQDLTGSLDRPNFRRADDCLPGASPGSSARAPRLLDLAVNTADEQYLGVSIQRIVDRAANASGACATLEVYDYDELSVTATFLAVAGVAVHGSCWHPDDQWLSDGAIVGETPVVMAGGPPLRANVRVPIERKGRVYGPPAIFENQIFTSLSADDQALMRMLAPFAACAIERAERAVSERSCADAAAARIADHLRRYPDSVLEACNDEPFPGSVMRRRLTSGRPLSEAPARSSPQRESGRYGCHAEAAVAR